jgi:hypothetical protein
MNRFTDKNKIVLEHCYIDSSYWKNGQVISRKIENGEDLTAFKESQWTNPIVIIAEDGYTIDFTSADNYIVFDSRSKMKIFNDSNQFTEPYPVDLTKISFDMFNDITPADVSWKNKIDFDGKGFLYKNLDLSKTKAIKKSGYWYQLLGEPTPTKVVFGYDSPYDYEINDTLQDRNGNFYGIYDRVNEIHIVATKSSGGNTDFTTPLFKSYILNAENLESLKNSKEHINDILINAYNYPLVIADDDLKDEKIVYNGVEVNANTKTFTKNIIENVIFKFTIPNFDISNIKIVLPFNNIINIDKNVANTILTGTVYYEVITNTHTLIITSDENIVYKGELQVLNSIPYNIDSNSIKGSISNRLLNNYPKCYLTVNQPTKKTNFIKGTIKSVVTGIYDDELNILNRLIENGVLINEDN